MTTADRPRAIGYAEDGDYGGEYDWRHAYVFHANNRFYIVVDTGCSCNVPASFYSEKEAVVGPAATLGGLLDELVVDKDKHDKVVKNAFLDAVKTINNDTLESARKVLFQ